MLQSVKPSDEMFTLSFQGRLDCSQAPKLRKMLADAMHTGHFRIQLNLARVDYISSAGVRVLLEFSHILRQCRGVLTIVEPSENVLKVIDATGMNTIVVDSPASIHSPAGEFSGKQIYDVSCSWYTLDEHASVSCRMIGSPEHLRHGDFTYRDHHLINCAPDLLALGLGVLGPDQQDFHCRCGEFMALSGCAMYQPAGSRQSLPDYMQMDSLVQPRIHAVYALQMQGTIRWCLRFTAGAFFISMHKLLQIILELTGHDRLALVIMGRSGGTVGATMRCPPFDLDSNFFAFPDVRNRLDFSSEYRDINKHVLAAGLLCRNPGNDLRLQSFIRPYGNYYGHFHAAVFDHFQLTPGKIFLNTTVEHLLQDNWPLRLFHMLNDDRVVSGGGDSLFSDGVVWISPVGYLESPPPVNGKEAPL